MRYAISYAAIASFVFAATEAHAADTVSQWKRNENEMVDYVSSGYTVISTMREDKDTIAFYLQKEGGVAKCIEKEFMGKRFFGCGDLVKAYSVSSEDDVLWNLSLTLKKTIGKP